MPFHGYGGSELDHSECAIFPCSACKASVTPSTQQVQPATRPGNTLPASDLQRNNANALHQPVDPTSGISPLPDSGHLSNYRRSTANTTADRPSSDVTGRPASSTVMPTANESHYADYSSGRGNISSPEEIRALREQLRRSGFRVPSRPSPNMFDPFTSTGGRGPPLSSPRQQPQNIRLSLHPHQALSLLPHQALSLLPHQALSLLPHQARTISGNLHPDDSRSDDQLSAARVERWIGPQAHPRYAPHPYPRLSRIVGGGQGIGGGSQGGNNTRPFPGLHSTSTRAPWADIEPTTEETLRRALENKKANQAAEELLRTRPPTGLPDSARRSTGDLGGPATRIRRMSGVTLDGDDSLDGLVNDE